jgi:hypothetical protein
MSTGAATTDEMRSLLKAGKPISFDASARTNADAADKARMIQASWIEALVEEPTRVIGVPIVIDGAIIDGPLRLPYATFAYDVTITNSVCNGPIELPFAVFKRGLTLDGSRFLQPVTLRAAHAEHDLQAERATFAAGLNVRGLRVREALIFRHAYLRDATFERSEIGGPIFFDCARCEGSPTRSRTARRTIATGPSGSGRCCR